MLSDRIQRIRELAWHSRNVGDGGWNELLAAGRAEGDGAPEIIREAKALAHWFRAQKVTILPDELLVGARPQLTFDDGPPVTQTSFGRQGWDAPEWWGIPADTTCFWSTGMLHGAGNHTTLNYEDIFAAGFRGILDRIADRRARLAPHETEARDFLDALTIIGKAYIDLSDRYAAAAEAAAAVTADPARRVELTTIAANCRRVPAESPRTFWEACQCAWFSFYFLPDSPGRVDKYLGPFYERDLAAGAIDPDFARELLQCLWLKVFMSISAVSGVSAINHLTLGGVNADGSDASNAVTWMCLDIVEELQVQRPQVGLAVHAGTPPALLERAVQALRGGCGSPDFCNADVIVGALHRAGVAVEDARDFSLSGCHEVIVTGRAQMGSVEGFINLPKLLRMALGLEPALQPDADLAAIDSPAALRQALTASMARVAEAAHRCSVARDTAVTKIPGADLLPSLVVRDCVENCRGYTHGGARYNFCNWDVIGLANLADAVAAVEQLVFAEGFLTLPEFAAVLARNWEDAEPLRQRIVGDLPHYGNDNAAIDALAGDLLRLLEGAFAGYTPYRGGRYILGMLAGGENMHLEFGSVTGATADGRRAGEPLADSIGAAQGRDRRGITALLNSVAGLPHELLPTAVSLNVKLDPKMLATAADVARIAALIRSHFAAGGQQFQFNLVDRAMLLAARENPEAYRNLMVRVAGYCAPWISLCEDLQNEIISRTAYQANC